ncbi:MAG: integral rane sensor signal transduction histidine kinase [Bryobacterales bacterium]|nr:integral rane sensor signal transduction histidine kinase [Bryobacterales bacterium]
MSALATDFTREISRRTLLRVISVGLGLMLLLVMAAAYFGYRESVVIQENARDLVGEQLPRSERAAALEGKIVSESAELLGDLEWILASCFLVALGISALTVWSTNRVFLRLAWQTRELDRVSWHLVDGHERISRRFSHEMHDELGQTLTALKTMLRRMTSEDLPKSKPEMMEVLDEAMRDVRELSQLLRPVILDDLGLEAGLRWLAERFGQRVQIPITCDLTVNRRLPEEIETHLFRIAQEALTNMARHSGATAATIRLESEGSRVVLTVEDNGRGLPSEGPSERNFGIVGMRARARQIGGELTVQNKVDKGLRVRVWAEVPEQTNDPKTEDPDHTR